MSKLSSDTDTITPVSLRQYESMSYFSKDSGSIRSMEAEPTDVYASLIPDDTESSPREGEGLSCKYPGFWWSGGAAGVVSLGAGLPRYYMSTAGTCLGIPGELFESLRELKLDYSDK